MLSTTLSFWMTPSRLFPARGLAIAYSADKIITDLRSRYVLGNSPTSPAKNGSYPQGFRYGRSVAAWRATPYSGAQLRLPLDVRRDDLAVRSGIACFCRFRTSDHGAMTVFYL
jgi:hypothetical protein